MHVRLKLIQSLTPKSVRRGNSVEGLDSCCHKLEWRCWFYARFLLSNNFYVSFFPVQDIVIITVSVLCYKPFRPRRFVMNSVLCHVLSVINPLPARLDNYLVSGNWKCRPEFSSLFVSLIIPRLGRPSHSPGMWLETFKSDTIPLSIMWTVKKNTNIQRSEIFILL